MRQTIADQYVSYRLSGSPKGSELALSRRKHGFDSRRAREQYQAFSQRWRSFSQKHLTQLHIQRMHLALAVRSEVAYAALCLTLAHPSTAVAEGANGAGFGMLPCRDARELLDQRSWRIPFAAWAFGYMTGLNAVVTQTERRYRDLSGLNVDLVVGTLKAACDAEPGGIVLQGADRLWCGLPSREWKVQP